MELTKSEMEIANRYLSKRERQLAQWPKKRWLILALFSVFMFVGYRNVSDGSRSIQEDRAADLDVSRAIGETPPAGLEYRWVVGTMMKISKVLELRHQVVSYALLQIALGTMQLPAAVTMVGLTILRWNTGDRDALICTLLRGKLQELEQVDCANPNAARAGRST